MIDDRHDGQDQRNIVTFSDLGNGRTELVVTECDWPAGFMMQMSRLGLEQSLDKMVGILIGEVT